MKIAVVTTLNQRLYSQYGHKFFETYNWPFDLYVYGEDVVNIPNKGVIFNNLFERVPSAKEFVERNKGRKFETFHHDAVRFCYKVYAYTDMIFREDVPEYDVLIYLDADSVFHKPIGHSWIKDNVYQQNTMTTYLGRGEMYTETGFLLFNLNHPNIKKFASECKRYYDQDVVYSLNQYHDCEVFDTVRKELEKNFGVMNFNIGDNKKGHVQARSSLGFVYDHCKGRRKKIFRSPENTKL